MQKDFTPVRSSGGQPYFSVVTTILSPSSSPAQSTTAQTLDTHGNLTQSQVFDYGNAYSLSGTPTRTYNFYYLTGSNYTSRYIFTIPQRRADQLHLRVLLRLRQFQPRQHPDRDLRQT